jgi:hypothetical protein
MVNQSTDKLRLEHNLSCTAAAEEILGLTDSDNSVIFSPFVDED